MVKIHVIGGLQPLPASIHYYINTDTKERTRNQNKKSTQKRALKKSQQVSTQLVWLLIENSIKRILSTYYVEAIPDILANENHLNPT